MTLVNSSIPNLINGVSQQPYALRLASQADLQTNAMSSVVEGLRKRPPTRFEFTVGNDTFTSSKLLAHQINRDSTEKYQVLVSANDIRVFDLLSKQELPVVFEGTSRDYLACDNPAKDLRALTVADFTFVLNRNVVSRSKPEVVEKNRPEGMIWVRQGAYGAKYSITLNGTTVSYLSPARSATDSQWNAGWRYETEEQEQAPAPSGYTPTPPRVLPKVLTQQHSATDNIAEELLDLLINNPALSGKFQFTRAGSLIRIRPYVVVTGGVASYPDFTLSATDSQGDTILKTFKDRVQNFVDLPLYCFDGFRIKVMGDDATRFDDYYVRYEGTTTGGVWLEDIADEERFKVDGATLPHGLIRQADGSFVFKVLDWEDRKVGDLDSNPMPSFIDKKIRDIFFFRNRFGMVAQENVSMSRYGDFFNFFKASATQLLDTDPIDVAVSHVKVSDINHAVAYNETLLLFAQETQFQIGSTDLLTPKTIAFNQSTEFACNPEVKPIGVGPYVYFTYERGEYAAVREYFVDDQASTDDAAEITSHVPKYIPGDIDQMCASQTESLLIALSSKTPNVIYVYNFYWGGDEKLQSSWSQWVFDAGVDVLSAQFIGSTLWLTMRRDGVITMESMDLSPGAVDDGLSYVIHLDRRVTQVDAPTSYNPSTDETTISLPYPPTEGLTVVTRLGNPQYTSLIEGLGLFKGYSEGEIIPYRIDGENIIVPHHLTSFYIGFRYETRYRFSTLTIKQQTDGGGIKSVVDGRLQLRKMVLTYADSGYFRVEVTPTKRDTFTYPMTAKTLGSASTILGRNRIASGAFNFPILSQNTEVTIDIVNDSFLPSAILSADWEAIYVTRSRRV